jgi:glycosyltransferase involved in cell wall biosynthesis
MAKVSVIVPNYNHARYLEQRIESILNQTYQDFELIYLDDASTDDSNEVFATFAQDGRIRALFNRSNSGSPFKQWNRGIKHAHGDYIWIAESDDYADPRFLETLVPILDKYGDVGLAYCQSHQVDSQGKCFAAMHWWTDDLDSERWRRNFINSGRDECAKYLVVKNTIPNASAVLIRKSSIEVAGYADESLSLSGDWLTWIKILAKDNVAFSAQILNYFRRHDSSVREKTSRLQYLYEEMQIFLFIKDNFVLSKELVTNKKKQLTDLWLHLFFGGSDRRIGTSNFRIYRAVKRYDPVVEFRLLAHLATHVLRRLKNRLVSLLFDAY